MVLCGHQERREVVLPSVGMDTCRLASSDLDFFPNSSSIFINNTLNIAQSFSKCRHICTSIPPGGTRIVRTRVQQPPYSMLSKSVNRDLRDLHAVKPFVSNDLEASDAVGSTRKQ
jgi:hypothetical protein